MSDGPHRSLNMKKGWKKLAECAGNLAFGPQEIAQRVPEALGQDWREEIAAELFDGIKGFFGDGKQLDWLNAETTQGLEDIRHLAAGRPLGNVFVDCAIQVAQQGMVGPAGFAAAVEQALLDRAMRGTRQVGEHWCRETSQRRASDVHSRLQDAFLGGAVKDLATQIASPNSGKVVERPTKQSGLDDGVAL